MSSKKAWESKLEQQMYELLTTALTRAECAARAVARVEYDLVQKHMESHHQTPPTTDPEGVGIPVDEITNKEAGAAQASREFNSSHFQTTFFNLNVLKVMEELIGLLDLQNLEDDVMHTMVQDMFRPRGNSAPTHSGEGETFIGSDADLMYHKLRQLAEKQQRGRQ